MKNLFPIFVKLEDRPVLVVGGGRVGEQKIRSLLATGARIHVVAPEATEAVQTWDQCDEITLEARHFSPSDLDGIFLVVSATSSRELNDRIFAEARCRGVLCNVVDVPECCDFYYPAVVQRGDLQIAISTAGQSPSLAGRIRQQLELWFGPEYGEWVAQLGDTRRRVLASNLGTESKRDLLQSLASPDAFEALVAAQSRTREGRDAA